MKQDERVLISIKKVRISVILIIAISAMIIGYTISLDNLTGVKNDCKAAFADGGGPYYIHDVPFREILSPADSGGEKLTIQGHVLLSDCVTPLPNAVINVWHADNNGNYSAEWYRGYVESDDIGFYRFETIMPSGYGEGTGGRPPHIHYKVFLDNREIITSQMFFPESRGWVDNAYIIKLENSEMGAFDIILPPAMV